MVGFCHFDFNNCTSLSKLITFDTGNQFDKTLLILGQESELSNLIVIIIAEKHQIRKKVKNRPMWRQKGLLM
jgi:hypothetical protein